MHPLIEALNAATKATQAAELRVKRASDDSTISPGEPLKVVRGRKIPKGTTAVLEGMGSNEYGSYVRFTLDGQTVFTARRNVEFPNRDAEYYSAVEASNVAREHERSVAKAIIDMAGVDLDAPLSKGELKQHSYSDTYEADYACNPDCPDDVLRAALNLLDPRESSWGRLRWSTGSSVVSRNGDVVRVCSGSGLCD